MMKFQSAPKHKYYYRFTYVLVPTPTQVLGTVQLGVARAAGSVLGVKTNPPSRRPDDFIILNFYHLSNIIKR